MVLLLSAPPCCILCAIAPPMGKLFSSEVGISIPGRACLKLQMAGLTPEGLMQRSGVRMCFSAEFSGDLYGGWEPHVENYY